MGNCQAIDTATLKIQHPSGKTEKLYCPVNATEIMKMNPGHYVALLISTTICTSKHNQSSSVRFTRIKLLRPTDTLVLGQVYRLITTQEVMKGLWAKKQARMKKSQLDSEGKKTEKLGKDSDAAARRSDASDLEINQATKHEKNRQRTGKSTNNNGIARSRTWQPRLKSISEAGS